MRSARTDGHEVARTPSADRIVAILKTGRSGQSCGNLSFAFRSPNHRKTCDSWCIFQGDDRFPTRGLPREGLRRSRPDWPGRSEKP